MDVRPWVGGCAWSVFTMMSRENVGLIQVSQHVVQ
jgi:hypothetical protein